MARPRTGSIKQDNENRWYVRYTYTDDSGKRNTVKRLVPENNKTHARKLLKSLMDDHDEKGRKVDAVARRFNDLTDWYLESYVRQAEYSDNTKVGGLRSWATVRYRVELLNGYFGRFLLRGLTYAKIEAYKRSRLTGETVHAKSNIKKPVSFTSVNRELEVLRRMLNLAMRERWIDRNPMRDGDQLIQKTKETPRQTILTLSQEGALLAACDQRTANLVQFAIETGMRRGEILKLTWKDVDMQTKEITIPKLNTKTETERSVVVSGASLRILRELYLQRGSAENLVFVAGEVLYKKFNAARLKAGFAHIRFHDLRHTFCTRLIEVGVPAEQAMKMSGHTTISTFLRYVNVNQDHLKQAARLLDAHRARG